jgi:hypothetical protein
VLGEHVFQRCRVLLLSFEDGKQELRRRIRAATMHHNIKHEMLGDYLHCAAINGADVRLAQMEDGQHKSGRLLKAITDEINRRNIDVVMLDPFIKIHGMDENGNTGIDFVTTLLTGIATEHNVAVLVLHHTRKGIAEPGNADQGRGASALKDAARLVYTLAKMSEPEAKNFKIDVQERRSLIRLDAGKVNLVPASEARWFKLIGVNLDNGTSLYPNGDNVQTVTPWTPPDISSNINADIEAEIIQQIDKGMANGQRYSASNAAKDRAVWKVVKAVIPEFTERQCRDLIDGLIEASKLVVRDYDDPVYRKPRKGLSKGV